MRYWLRPMCASAALAILGACGSEPPTSPPSQALLDFVAADVPPELAVGDFVVCKVGTDADFTYAINQGTPLNTTIADGDCEVIHSASQGGPVDHVSITEDPIPVGYRLDRVEVWTIGEAGTGPPYEVTMSTEQGPSHAGEVEDGKLGCVLVYYNVPDFTNPGTGTPGYWAQHPEAWPVGEIEIGGVTYSKAQAIGYMLMPVRGDKTLTLFPKVVSAKLNVLIGNDSSCVADELDDADDWLATYPVGSNVRANSDAWDAGEPLSNTLRDYNNGELCAPHRD